MGPYRAAAPAPWIWNVCKTLLSLTAFWFVVLIAIPIAISVAEIQFGIQRFPPQVIFAGPALLAFSVLGVWAALTLAIVGEGTPLPFDTARKLVTSGPYAYLRHPLTVATIGLGAALSVSLGSIPVSVYVAVAVAAWHFLIRPVEEQDLEARFGAAWRNYAANVRATRPRLTPYRPGGPTDKIDGRTISGR